MPQPSLLLILNDPEEATRLETWLVRRGVHVHPAASGLEGLKLFCLDHFDAVVTDLRLPGLSGSHVAQFVRTFSPSTLIVGLGTLTDGEISSCDHILFKSPRKQTWFERIHALVWHHHADTLSEHDSGRMEIRHAVSS